MPSSIFGQIAALCGGQISVLAWLVRVCIHIGDLPTLNTTIWRPVSQSIIPILRYDKRLLSQKSFTLEAAFVGWQLHGAAALVYSDGDQLHIALNSALC